MRPPAIIMFERLYLAALAIGLFNAILAYDANVAELSRVPSGAQLGPGSGIFIAVVAVSMGISLLLWYFIARRASNIAKWVLLVFTVIGLAMIAANPKQMLSLTNVLSWVISLVQLVAIGFLFRADAREWLTRRDDKPGNPKEPGVRLR